MRRYPVKAVPTAYDLDSIRKRLTSRLPGPSPLESSPDPANAPDFNAIAREAGLGAAVSAAEVQVAAAARGDNPRRAAVAAVLRPRGDDTEVLLIRRAEREGDPWSGHMALPGGHQEPRDADLRATALRETLEEVGLDLSEHEYLGQLDELPATIRGRRVGISIAPHVFALRAEPRLRPNYEVAEIVWGELGPMARGERDYIKEWRYEGELRRVPAFRVNGHVVWGLTHHILGSLFEVLEWRPRAAL